MRAPLKGSIGFRVAFKGVKKGYYKVIYKGTIM